VVLSLQHRPDGSGMVAQRWLVGADPCVCPQRQATIRTDSGPMRHDEATHRSLLIILTFFTDFELICTKKYK